MPELLVFKTCVNFILRSDISTPILRRSDNLFLAPVVHPPCSIPFHRIYEAISLFKVLKVGSNVFLIIWYVILM